MKMAQRGFFFFPEETEICSSDTRFIRFYRLLTIPALPVNRQKRNPAAFVHLQSS